MKKILILFSLFILACSGGGGGSTPAQGTADITLLGDSIAKYIGYYWPDADSQAIGGTDTIDWINILSNDNKTFKTVVLSVGGNDTRHYPEESVSVLVARYIQVYDLITADAVYCLPIVPIETSINSQKVLDFNANVKIICGENYYVDIWKIEYTTDDGTHPDEKTARAIIALIEEMILKNAEE